MKALGAGVGGLLGGFGLYSLIAAYGGGVDLEDLVTFDQGGELGFGGILVFYGIVAGALVGVPLGCYLALRLLRAPRAGRTALVAALSAAAVTAAALAFLPSGPGVPLLQPPVVFAGWLLAPVAAAALLGPRAQRPLKA
jgi:hypothetical protein